MVRRPGRARTRRLAVPLVGTLLVCLVATGCGGDGGDWDDGDDGADVDDVAVLLSDEEGTSFLDVDPTGTRLVRSGGSLEGAPSLLVRDVDQGPFEPLLTTGDGIPAFQPKWADDGRVVFITRDSDEDAALKNERLAVAAADGASVDVIDESAGTYDAIYGLAGVTGDVVYYVRFFDAVKDRTELVSIRLDGTGFSRVMPLDHDDSPSSFTLSPDGTRMAWSRSVDNSPRVMVAGIDGSDPVEIAEGASPAWSPDGDRLVFIAEVEPTNDEEFGLSHLMTVAADGSGEPRAVPGQYCCWRGSLAWLPDDRVIVSDVAYVVGEGRLYTLAVD